MAGFEKSRISMGARPGKVGALSGAGVLGVEAVTSEKEFFALKGDWDRLALGNRAGVFSSFDWAWGWWNHVGNDPAILGRKRLLVLVLRTAGRVVGLAPLIIRTPRRRGLSLRKVEFVGSTFNDYNEVLWGDDRERQARTIAAFLVTNAGSWDVIDLRNLPSESATAGLLERAFIEHGLRCRRLEDDSCPFFGICTDWEGMLRGHSRRTRHTYHNQANRLKRLEDEGWRVRIIESPQDEPGLLERMAQVERRKKVRGAVLDRLIGPAHKFIEYLFQTLGPAGRLYVAVMEKADRLVSYEMGFRSDYKFWNYVTAFDPAFSKMSPGTMLLPTLVRYGFQNQYDEYDFLRGEESYKTRLAESVHATFRLQAWKQEANSRLKALLYFKVKPSRHSPR